MKIQSNVLWLNRVLSMSIFLIVMLSLPILNVQAQQWEKMSEGTTTNDLIHIWNNAENELLISSSSPDSTLHYDGSQWTTITNDSSLNSDYFISDSWTSPDNEIFAVGCINSSKYSYWRDISCKQILHYNGVDWTEMDRDKGKGHTLEGIWGSATDDVFAVGEMGAIFHYDGLKWTKMTRLTLNHLYDVWGSAKDNVFAVGEAGTILHYDGNQWTIMDSGSGQTLKAIWGTAENNIFAIGDKGRILHYDGISWIVTIRSTENLRSIWGNATNNIFAVGDAGTILHYDGCRWTEMDSNTNQDIYDIIGNTEQGTIAVGEKGLILHLTDIPESTTDENLCEKPIINTEPVLELVADFSQYTVDRFRVLHAYRGDTLHFTATATDKENNRFEFGLSIPSISDCDDNSWRNYQNNKCEIPAGASIDPNTGVFTWIPEEPGRWLLTVTVTETDGDQANRLSDEETILIEVNDVAVNDVAVMESKLPSAYDIFENIIDLTNNGKSNNCACQNPLLSMTKTKLSDLFSVITNGYLPTNFWKDEKSDSLVLIHNDFYDNNIYHYDGHAWYAISNSNDYPFDRVYGIWGYSANNIFIVGEFGTILHYNGSEWMGLNSSTEKDLYSVWGTSENNVFAVGWDGTILHYDGSNWHKMNSSTQETLFHVWGTSTNDVFAVGMNGTILHYDGSKWTTMNSGTNKDLFGILGCASNDVYAIGSSGIILHYDGTQWQEKSILGVLWDALWGTDEEETVAEGWFWINQKTANHLTVMESNTNLPLESVLANSTRDVFAVGGNREWWRGDSGIIFHYDGNQWTETFNSDIWLHAIWGSSENDVFAVGNNGTILHYNGQLWQQMESGVTNDFRAIWGSSDDDVFVVGNEGVIFHYDGQFWRNMGSGVTNNLNAIWGSSDDDVFVVGGDWNQGIILHYDGLQWTEIFNAPFSLKNLQGNTENEVSVTAQNGAILHYEGNRWVITENSESLWGNSSGQMFALDEYNYRDDKQNIFHYDGSQWTEMFKSDTELNAIWGSSKNDVFVVGGDWNQGIILHYDGSQWIEQFNTSVRIDDIYGNTTNDVFAETRNGSILHYDGERWTTTEQTEKFSHLIDEDDSIEKIWGNSTDNNVLGIGCWFDRNHSYDFAYLYYDGFYYDYYSDICHYNGNQWTPVAYGIGISAHSYYSSIYDNIGIDNEIFIVGDNGLILHYDFNKEVPESTSEIIVNNEGCEPTINIAPILDPIGNQQVVQGETFSFTATAQDAESHLLTYTLNEAPTGVSIEPNTGLVTWTPTEIGDFSLTVVVSEVETTPPLSDEETITITVEPPPIEEDTTEIVENTCLENAPTLPDFGNEVTNIWWNDLGLEAFAIGMAGKIVHWKDFSLTEMNSGTTHDLFGIWGTDSSDLFVVGNNGTILHYDGLGWTTMNSGTEKHLYNLWGPTNNNVFAVAQTGTIIHYNGNQWAPINSNTTNDLFGIWGSSANNIFAVGLNGTILHYDGNQWTSMNSPTTTDLFSIWGTSGNDIYATSEDNSTIIHYEGSQWTELLGGGLTETLDDYPELSDELGELNGILDYGNLELSNNLGFNLGTLPANNPNDCVNSNIEPVLTEPTPEPTEIIVTEPLPPETCQNSETTGEDGKNGMTWAKRSHDDVLGVDYVNCSNCNAYSGETSCSSKLPILCLKKENLPDPGVSVPDKSPGVMSPRYYYGWTGGHIELTSPVSGNALKGISDANDICEFQFGPGYKMAEHHDGNGGWGWYAYGNIDDSSRFWVSINDQSSNCWGDGSGVSSARTDAQISELLNCGGSATTQEPTIIDSEANNDDSKKTIIEPIVTEPTPEPAEIIVTDETSETEKILEPSLVEEIPNETLTSIEPVTTLDTYGHPNTRNDEEITLSDYEKEGPQLDEYPIVVKTLGTGIVTGEGIDCGSDCTEIHARGSTITLTATPEEGSNFTGWIGDCRSNNPSITLIVNAALNCTALFDMVPNRNLSINVVGEGSGTITAPVGLGNGIDCGKTCIENYPDGTVITFTAQPEIGSTFSGWLEESCTDELTITNDMTCTATFERLPNDTLTISTAEDHGTFIIEPPGEVCGENCTRHISGTEITLTAVPESDYRLLNWAGDCEGTTTSISFQLTTDMNCTAIWEPKPTEATETDLESKPTESPETANDIVVIREELVPLPETTAIDAQGNVMRTEAGFAGGISVDQGETFEQQATLTASEPINIQSQIVIDPEHVGQVTDVLVVAAYQPLEESVKTRSTAIIYYYMLDIEGHIFPWDGEMANLISFQSVKTPTASLEVPVWNQPIGVTGKVNVYVGYRLIDGTVVYSPQTLDITVNDE
jgi:hypothetical protein